MNYKKMICILFCIGFLFSNNFISAKIIKKEENTIIALEETEKSDWAVMVYLAADVAGRNNFIDYFFDIFKDIGSNDEFKLIMLVDGLEIGDTGYYYIEKDVAVPLSWYETESDMASSKTFERFINLTKYYYPAEHYALITISDNGAGWQGVFSDTHGTGKLSSLSILPIVKVGKVLKNVTCNGSYKIDLWATDVCIPGTTEVAYEISPYVNYFVANQECGGEGKLSQEKNMPLDWNYSSFLAKLKENNNMSPENFAKTIVTSFNPGTWEFKLFFNLLSAPKWYPIPKFHTTLSSSNLSNINKVINSINILSTKLLDNINEIKKQIKNTRSEVREYGNIYRKFWFIPPALYYVVPHKKIAYDGYIDLYDFVLKLKNKISNRDIKNSCEKVMKNLSSMIIENNVLSSDSSHGLSIYFPDNRFLYNQHIHRKIGEKSFRKIPSKYEETLFSQNTNWDEFLKAYLRIK